MRRALVSNAALEEGTTCSDRSDLLCGVSLAVRWAAPPAPERFAGPSLPSS